MSGSRAITFTTAGGATRTVDLLAYLGADDAERAANESNAWIKSLRTAVIDERSFRDRFTYRGDSLWWFAELFLHRQGVITDLWRVALALDTLCARERPTRLTHAAGDRLLDLLAPQAAARHGATHGLARSAHHDHRDADRTQNAPGDREARALDGRRSLSSGKGTGAGLKSVVYTWTALASRLRPRSAAARAADRAAPGGTLVFVHSAFVHGSGEEGYIGAILRELQQRPDAQPVRLVGVGPRTNFKARRWWHPLLPGRGRGRAQASASTPESPSNQQIESPPAQTAAAQLAAAQLAAAQLSATAPIVPVEELASWRDLADSRALWRERHALARALLSSASLRARARLHGYDIWPIVREELRGVAQLQFTWSARVMDEAGAAMEKYRPTRVVTYAEAGGWGRAIMLEARRRGIASIGLQHGFIYRHWLNYLHLPDEMAESAINPSDRGFPRPDRTLLYDAYAARHLRQEGHFPAEALRVTGSPGLDALVAAIRPLTMADRASIRARLGVEETATIGVIVSKHTQIREALPALAAAAAARPELRLIVKPHPAEVSSLYDAPGLRVAPPDLTLASLLAVAELIITVNSTVAIDALTLGVPSLAVLLPNNLSPFVSAGAMAGVPAGAPGLAPMLEALDRLRDPAARAALLARGSQFLRDAGDRGDAGAGPVSDAGPASDVRGDGQAARRAADAILATRPTFPVPPVASVRFPAAPVGRPGGTGAEPGRRAGLGG